MKSAHFNARLKIAAAGIALCLSLHLGAAHPAHANDHIFPSASSAKSAIDFDRRGFLIHGRRTFIVSAGMEYARVPRALWRDRLQRLQRAGFNCVEIYTFWNFHEPQEGKFNFSGDHDLNAFLQIVKQMGMYAIVRVGPYYCAEWDLGGYPLWLRFKPGVHVREPNAPFEKAVSHFFDKLIPIVAANQINRGGSVILVQLENEHPSGWGTEEPNSYFKFLRAKALSLGLETPYFFSGLHHGSDPAGDASDLDDPARPNPWMTTEFWAVWYSQYGPKPGDAETYDRRTWKIIAHGGNGYNYYMAHGGTNFGYTNNNEDAASYDYGTGVGQGGDLRPIYYRFKRAAWFARSFQEILENSVDASGDFQAASGNPAVRVSARRSPAGTIVFLDNPGESPARTQFAIPKSQDSAQEIPLTLAPGEIMPVVHNFSLAPGIGLQWSVARILGIAQQGTTTTLVAYGPAKSQGRLQFTVPAATKILQGGADLQQTTSGMLTLNLDFPSDKPSEYLFSAGKRLIRILAVSDTLADRTWFVETGGQTDVVCGPSYVADATVGGGQLQLTTERPWSAAADPAPTVYGPGAQPAILRGQSPYAPKDMPETPKLGVWQTRSAALPAVPEYQDTAWLTSDAPLQMGADGNLTADAWYRAKIQTAESGRYTLHFSAARDRMTVFVDGAQLPAENVQGNNVQLSLTAGAHTIAIFTAHDGRDKLYNFLGAIEAQDAKGLVGPAMLQQGATSDVIGNWRVLKLPGNPGSGALPPDSNTDGWSAYTVGQDPFQGRPGFAWFQAALPALAAENQEKILQFPSVDDNATVFLNGRMLTHHEGWNKPFDAPLGGAWQSNGPNLVTVLVENTAGAGGIAKPVTLNSYRSQSPVTGWRMRGGPGDPDATDGWAALPAASQFSGPQFFRTQFSANPPTEAGPHPIWRVVATGLGHGSVWVNGHNLGRYPEKIPINGLYIPECWLKAGENSLVIYDEDGKRPDQVTIETEAAASRNADISLFGL